MIMEQKLFKNAYKIVSIVNKPYIVINANQIFNLMSLLISVGARSSNTMIPFQKNVSVKLLFL